MRDNRHYYRHGAVSTPTTTDPSAPNAADLDLAAGPRMARARRGERYAITYLSSRHGRLIDRTGEVVRLDTVEDDPALGDDDDPLVTLKCRERRDRTRSLVVNVRTGRVTSNGFYVGPLVDVQHVEDSERVLETSSRLRGGERP